jgi:hypothetical protein
LFLPVEKLAGPVVGVAESALGKAAADTAEGLFARGGKGY